jgi:hypothetical protein
LAGDKLLTQYLIELSEDADLRRLYAQDPKKAVSKSMLTQASQDALLSGDPKKIQLELDKENATALVGATYMVSNVVASASP